MRGGLSSKTAALRTVGTLALLVFLGALGGGCATVSKRLDRMERDGRYVDAIEAGEKWLDRHSSRSTEGWQCVFNLVTRARLEMARERHTVWGYRSFQTTFPDRMRIEGCPTSACVLDVCLEDILAEARELEASAYLEEVARPQHRIDAYRTCRE